MGGSTGGGDLPGWAARHLAESDDPGVRADVRVTSGPATGRHRRARRGRASDSGFMRGWGLAVAAIAAAAGAVPMAVSALDREDVPLPRVGAFPVAVPADLPEAGAAERVPARDQPGPDLAGVLPPPPADFGPVAPTANSRALPPAPALAAAPQDAATTTTTPPAPSTTTPTTTTTTPPSTTDSQDVEFDDPEPREATRDSDDSDDSGDSGDSGDSDERSSSSDRDGGLVGGVVGGVTGTVDGLLN